MSLDLPFLDDRVAVSGQLGPADMKRLAAAGFLTVVNNRPDGEAMFGQPRTAELKQAALGAGLTFLDLPFSGPRATPAQARSLADLLTQGDGKIVAFCKSGMRSALLWAAATMVNGRPLDEVLRVAAHAGQKLDHVADVIEGLAGAARR